MCVLAILMVANVQAAPKITVPWQCSFEQTEDLSDWVLNAGTSQAGDRWMIGDATRSDGKQSLYITTDGVNPVAGVQPNVVMAYRRFYFPQHTTGFKEYDISFDWKAMGEGTLYVYFNYASVLLDGANNMLQYASASSTIIPLARLNEANYVYSTGYTRRQGMTDEMRWRNVSLDAGSGTTYSVRLSANNSKKEFALLFVWVNKNMTAENVAMGACIDNIQIASAVVEKPTNLTAQMQCEDSSFVLNWKGNVSNYSVEYRRSDQATWRKYTYTATPPYLTYRIKSLKESTYDFRVRGWKGTDTTAYTVLNDQLLLCLDNHCINYIALDKAECTYGVYAGSAIDPYTYQGKIDNGSDDYSSFHTVCADTKATDIRTDHKLKQVPDGALASVRLGTWIAPGSNKMDIEGSTVQIGGYSISYDLTVDTATQALVLLQYAMVMENPTGHTTTQMPYFRLEVLRDDGSELDATCGSKEFYCPLDTLEAAAQGWQVYRRDDFPANKTREMGLNSVDIFWKDWTAMGINLIEAGATQGEHLRVRVIAEGCTIGGHYGYGYFTLDCASATIETDQCSGSPTATADAPEGFSYIWYAERNRDLFEAGTKIDKDGNKVIVSRDENLSVMAGDTNVYVCRLTDQVNPSCYFELKTKLSPRTPYPMFQYAHTPLNCKNIVTFRDSSRVCDYAADGTVNILSEAAEFSDFEIVSLKTGKKMNNSNQEFQFEADATGDTLEITHTAYIADGSCSRTDVDTIVVDNILTPDSMLTVTTCFNLGYTFHGEKLQKTGVYTHAAKNRYGCDSLEILDLTVNPISNVIITDTICSADLPYIVLGNYKGTPMTYQRGVEEAYATTQHYSLKLSNHYDCDSFINLTLTVVPLLQVKVDPIDPVCADDGQFAFSYSREHGDFDSLCITFSDKAHLPHFRDTVIYHNPYLLNPSTSEQIVYPYTSDALPGLYEMEARFYQHSTCGAFQTYRLPIDLRYASSVIEQKWNDVISVKNSRYNGGYTFTSYQWYKDGQPIPDATHSYLYTPLSFGSEYSVLLTRPDGVSQWTCPIVATDRTQMQVTEYPTLVGAAQQVPIRMNRAAQVGVYTISGQLIQIVQIPESGGVITTPNEPGYYILRIE